jgi:hypothetical protein
VRSQTLPRRPQPLGSGRYLRPLPAAPATGVAANRQRAGRRHLWLSGTRRRSGRGGCHAGAIYAELPGCLPRFSPTCRARRPTE